MRSATPARPFTDGRCSRIGAASRRGHDARQPTWSPTLVKAVHDMCTDHMQQDQTHYPVATTGIRRQRGHRILKNLVEKGAVSPVPTLRRKAPRAARRRAKRPPKGRKPAVPGEIFDAASLAGGRPPRTQRPHRTQQRPGGSTRHGTCPTKTLKTSTAGPSPTSSTHSDLARHSTDTQYLQSHAAKETLLSHMH